MRFTGKFAGAQVALDGTLTITLSINEKADAINQLGQFDREELQSIEIKKYRKQRSVDANALLWSCLGEMAVALETDKWQVYLMMLRRYGSFTYISVKEQAVPRLKEIWRECEEVGRMPDGNVQMLCYYGSSTYDTKEFSTLLDGVIYEMRQLGIQPPMPKHVNDCLERWEESQKERKRNEKV